MIFISYKWLPIILPFILADILLNIILSLFGSRRFWISVFAVSIVAVAAATAKAGAWEELNAQRAHMGLPPMIQDEEATAFAQMKAEYQAARGISGFYPDSMRSKGMTGHEGPRFNLPHVEGTGCSRDGYWMTCAMRSIGQPRAGAGIATGSDGARYMCLIVLGRNHRDGGVRRPLMYTAHLKDSPPQENLVERVFVPDSATMLVSFQRIIIPTSETYLPSSVCIACGVPH